MYIYICEHKLSQNLVQGNVNDSLILSVRKFRLQIEDARILPSQRFSFRVWVNAFWLPTYPTLGAHRLVMLKCVMPKYQQCGVIVCLFSLRGYQLSEKIRNRYRRFRKFAEWEASGTGAGWTKTWLCCGKMECAEKLRYFMNLWSALNAK